MATKPTNQTQRSSKLKWVLGAVGVGALLWLLTRGVSAAPSGAVIVATAMPLDKTSCAGLCTVNGSATWQNTGDVAGTFTPMLAVNGVNTVIGEVQTLQPGASVTISFSVPISVQTTFCPVPGGA